MTTEEITHERAVEIDTKLADLWQQRAKASTALDSAKLSLASGVGIRPHYVTKTRREVTESLATLVEMAEAKIADPNTPAWKVQEIERTLARARGYQHEIVTLDKMAAPLNALYAEHKWQRFFLVTNQNGHIHSSMACHSCNVRTAFAWLPELSGLTEKDAVEAHGPHLCTHCFPTAPVEWTLGEQPKDEPCSGSGSADYDRRTWRRTSYTGAGRAVCGQCSATVSILPSGLIRKHKKAS